MSRWPAYLAILVLLTVVVALVFEAKRSAELLGTAELAAHKAEQRAIQAEQQLSEFEMPPPGSNSQNPQLGGGQPDGVSAESPKTQEPLGAEQPKPTEAIDLSDYTRLQVELHTTKEQLGVLTKLLNERNDELERRVKAAAAAAKSSLKPMPQGVRHCLQALHECLRIEGYTSQRFLRAMALDAEGLHEVEMLEASANGLSVAFLRAGRMTAQVDRSVGMLELRFFDGHRAVDGERAALPEEGFVMTFKEIDGRLFERRLPFLVRGVGSYVTAAAKPKRPATDLDPGTRRQWLSRMEKVLSRAKTDLNWRVSRLRGLDGAQFLKIELVGTDDKNLVVASAHCDRMAFEIDERSGVVSLLLNDGVLRQRGAESTITGEGYRMLLPGLTPKETIDAMLGMIVKK
jgi:hypothetical protein